MKRSAWKVTVLTLMAVLSCAAAFAQSGVPFNTRELAKTRDYWPTAEWRTADPASKGMNPAQLDKAERFYAEMFPSAYSLIVIRHGYIVKEAYYNDMNAESTPHIFSITKSFTSALTGIAISEGLIKGVDETLPSLFPEYVTADMDPAKKTVTVEQMLTHTSGLTRSGGGDDWMKNTVQGKLAFAPGSRFEYSNVVPDLLSGVIAKRSGMDTRAYAEAKLLGPLGIKIGKWDTTPLGVYQGANGMYTSARDLARLGYLYLNYGVWDGRQILPASWVEQSGTEHAKFDGLKGYGYLMWVWLPTDTVQGYKIKEYYPYGHRGQYIGIFPDLDLLVVMSADATDDTRDTFFVMDYIHDYIRLFVFPAITDIPK